MNSGIIITALALISGLTSLTVEALKKIFNEKQIQYSSNLLAAIVAVILTVAVSIGYIIYTSTVITPQIIITVIAIIFLSFLGSTVGYDKVVQLIKQIGA